MQGKHRGATQHGDRCPKHTVGGCDKVEGQQLAPDAGVETTAQAKEKPEAGKTETSTCYQQQDGQDIVHRETVSEFGRDGGNSKKTRQC